MGVNEKQVKTGSGLGGTAETILDASMDGFWVVDSQGRILDVNDAYCTMVGYTREELLSITVADIEAGETSEEVSQHIEHLKTAGSHRFETRHRHKDGHEVPVEASVNFHDVGEGRIFAFFRDISDRRQQESSVASLYTSLARVRGQQFFDDLVAHIGRWLGMDCVLIGRVVGGTRVETYAMFLDGDVSHGYAYDLAGTPCQNVANSGFCVYPRGVCGLFPADEDLVKLGAEGYVGVPLKDGETGTVGVLCAISKSPLSLHPQTEEVLNAIAARATLETERAEAEKSIRRVADEWTSTFDSIDDMISIQDEDFKLIKVNKAYARRFGESSPDALIGKRCCEVVHGTRHPHRSCPFSRTRKTHKPEVEEFREESLGMHVEVSTSPILDENGAFKGSVHIIKDISARKEAESRLRSALSKSLQHETEVKALLEASRAVIQHRDFERSARAIFDSCKSLIGATSGYVALLSEDGEENEVLFLEAGGRPCSVDPSLPMPVRGLRGEAYKSSQVVFDNDFMNGKWVKFMPGGHVRLDNVLFAPLVVQGKTVGIMGLANKEGGFTDHDAELAEAFGEMAAIALDNSRLLESIRNSEEWYRVLLNSFSDALFVHPMNSEGVGPFSEVNDAACNRLGYTREELLALLPTDIDAPESQERFPEIVKEFLDKGHIMFETMHMVKDGARIPVEINSRLLDFRGQPTVLSVARDISERKRTEIELAQRSRQLGERVKELKCLYGLAELVRHPEATIESASRGMIELIAGSWQYPEVTCARVTLSGEVYATPGFMQTQWRQTAEITVGGHPEGLIEVCYVEERPQEYEGPFVKEERALIDGLAEQLGAAVERFRAREQLREHREHLEQLVRERTGELSRANDELQWNYETQRVVSRLLQISQRSLELRIILESALREILSVPWLAEEGKGAVFLVGDKSETLTLAAQHGLPQELQHSCRNVPFGKCLCGRAVLAERTEFAERVDERHEIRYDGMEPHGHYCVPIKSADGPIGVLNVYLKEGHVSLAKELEFLEAAANTLAGIIIRLRAEAGIHESEARFRQLAENIPEVFWIRDTDSGKIVYVSPAYEKVWGRPIQSMYDDDGSWLASLHEDDRGWVVASLARESDPGGNNIEYRIRRPDGAIRWIRSRSFPVKNKEGRVFRVAGVTADITAFKEAAEKEQVHQQQLMQADKMTSLGILVSGVAHEINNPNNLIMLNSDVLSRTWGEAVPILDEYASRTPDFVLSGLPYDEMRGEFNGLLGGISEGADRIRNIVHNLKDFVRVDAGDLNQEVDLNAVIESAIFIVGNLIKKSTSRFTLRCTPDLPRVTGNAQQIEQVVINLISNACQALQSSDSAISVSTGRNEDGTMVWASISDEGTGIAQEDLPKVMDPFFTTKRDTGGTGLGLSVSYTIVQAHDGRLRFDTGVGKGTTAIVELPVRGEESA